MDEYPRTLVDFERHFSTEEQCRAYLLGLRWPEGFRCPRCGHGRAWARTGRPLLKCTVCGHHASVTAGTIFHRSHVPLPLWFKAIWWMIAQKSGGSALGFQQALGVGSYRTAWMMLHKLRRAMVRPHRERLRGRVEVDETYVGGVVAGPRGRGALGKALVAVAAEEDGRRIGRICLARVADASAASLGPFVQGAVEPGACVVTDGWEGYDGLRKAGYRHRRRPIRGSGKTASTLLPRVHRVVALLKRWLLSTHQGAAEPQHLAHYLD